jgi:16S rRNA C1402 (ribose-2'-O) methylase RsmI
MRQDRALFDADVIACEDTRSTGMLIRLLKSKRVREGVHELHGQKLESTPENQMDEDEIEASDVVFSNNKELVV